MKTTRIHRTFFVLLAALCSIASCQKIMPGAPAANEVMDAPLDGLTPDQNKLFAEGADEFDEVYTRESGLGPIYVSSSCGSCHAGDNRGHVFTTLTRFGQSDTSGNTFMHLGGPQLQHNFLTGYTGEQVPANATSSRLVAPIVAGSGFLELVADQDLLNMSDPNDQDGDGISGRVNWTSIPEWVIPSANAISQHGKYIGRFGKKASTYNIHQQTVQAFNQDMGITTTFMPDNPVNYQSGLQSSPTADPEISDQSVNATVFYIQTLQTPFRRNANDAMVLQGAALFNQIKCNSCHKEMLHTQYSNIAALSQKEFSPFTDLLLHDMGAELDDHYTEGTAYTNEWRTAPLWGLGLASQAQGGKYALMHDGRAKSIEQAIEMHAGESLKSKQAYQALSSAEKDALVQFLKSL